MSQMLRTTLRLDLDKPASANAVALLRQLHAERGLSYSALIVPAVNAYYGKPTVDEGLRETIRSIVREELAVAPVQLGDLLQALKTAVPASPFAHDDEPDENDLMASQPWMKACGRRFAQSSGRSWQLRLFSLEICCKP